MAIAKPTVDGNVLNAECSLVKRTAASNPDAGIGSIQCQEIGASSAAAGVADVTGDGFGHNDGSLPATAPRPFARISITTQARPPARARRMITFGITAQQIGKLIMGPTGLLSLTAPTMCCSTR